MNQEETSRRFYPPQPPFSCGIALHARTLDVCILDQRGEIVLHRHRQTAPETFLTAIAPSRDGTVVAVACLCTWYGRADLGADAGLPFVLGQALSRKTLHGGQANNDPSDAHKRAVLLRGGRLPQAAGSPAQRRATRALLRRRRPLARKRAELLAHGQHTNSQDTLPALGPKMADQATRDGVADRGAEPAGHKSLAGALALLTSDDERRGAVDRPSVHPAPPQDAHTLYLRHPVPGRGTRLRRVLRYDRHDLPRVPRGQDVVSACRLVTCAKASAGKRVGPSGATIGHAHRTGACSEAAVWFLRAQPAAQHDLPRVEKTPDPGQAVTVRAQQLARAVYHLRTRQGAFERETCCHREGRGAGAPGAARDNAGRTLPDARDPAAAPASVNAQAPLGRETLSPAL